MTVRKLHTLAGLCLLLPFLAWIGTALVFYLKPGYDDAYAMLSPRTYPLAGAAVSADSAWREARLVRTILGTHLLVRTERGWEERDAATHAPRPMPGPEALRTLVADAIAGKERYGEVARVDSNEVRTTTGVVVTVDWERLSLSQRGPDTDRIDLLYRVHYLQWSGIPAVDRVLGPAGLALVALLSALGVRLALRR